MATEWILKDGRKSMFDDKNSTISKCEWNVLLSSIKLEESVPFLA